MTDKQFHSSDGQTMDEAEYIISSSAMVDILHEGDVVIGSGNFQPIAIEDRWK